MHRTRVRTIVGVVAGAFVATLTSVFTAPRPAAPANALPAASAQRPAAQAPAGAAAAPQAAAPQAAVQAELATINQYCVGCHNDRAKMGGVSFQGITAAGIAEHAEVFEKAVKKMRGRVMPPPGARQPDAA